MLGLLRMILQLIRASNMVMSSLKYCKTYRANILEPEIFHLNPKQSDTLKFRKFVRWDSFCITSLAKSIIFTYQIPYEAHARCMVYTHLCPGMCMV